MPHGSAHLMRLVSAVHVAALDYLCEMNACEDELLSSSTCHVQGLEYKH